MSVPYRSPSVCNSTDDDDGDGDDGLSVAFVSAKRSSPTGGGDARTFRKTALRAKHVTSYSDNGNSRPPSTWT